MKICGHNTETMKDPKFSNADTQREQEDKQIMNYKFE